MFYIYSIISFSAVLLYAAASVAALRGSVKFLNLLGLLGLCCSVMVVARNLAMSWDLSFAGAIWVSISSTLLLLLVFSTFLESARGLLVLMMPYCTGSSFLACLFPETGLGYTGEGIPNGWLILHIIFSVVTYGTLTLTAMAGVSIFLQEHALKTKIMRKYTKLLPGLNRSMKMESIFLQTSFLVLLVGIVTGASIQFYRTGTLIVFDHKTILSIIAFTLVSLVVCARRSLGLRGKRASRLILAAWLILTLAYPGVKLVTSFTI